MPRAVWNGAVLAESKKHELVEGNVYFPPESLNREYFKENDRHSTCPWKGVANYYDLEVDGEVNKGAAWTYPDPSKAASNIKNYVAFWGGVKVETLPGEDAPGVGGFLETVKQLFGL